MITLGEKETYKYLEIFEADTITQVEMKEKVLKKEYTRRTRKLLETDLCKKESHQRDKHLGNSPCKILRTFLTPML